MPDLVPVLTAPEESNIVAIDDLFSYDKMKIRINNIIDSWRELCDEAIIRRDSRYTKLDIEALRQSGDIQEDETFIPNRVIDTNIAREKPEAMAFLKQSSRLAIFKCTSNPDQDSRELEKEFTQGLTYKGWYREFDRTIDGAALHGWDSIEVVFDSSKPLNIGFEHVSYDRLFFNRKAGNFQDSDIVLRKYEVTTLRLEEFKTKYGFDSIQVDAILDKDKDKKNVDNVHCIYKVYYKKDGAVQIAWYSKETNVSGWLKNSEPLRLGIKIKQQAPPPSIGESLPTILQGGVNPMPALQWIDQPIDIYPMFPYLYKDDEQEQFTEHKGRAFMDEPQQEASTSILTGYVNRLMRSSNVYGSPATDDGESAEIKQLDVQLIHGGIYSKPINFFSIDPPDVSTLASLQYLDTLNSQNTGKVSYAVSNRKDSRKTARELEMADQKETQLSSTTIAAESEWLREVFDFAWRIVKSQALQGKIKFLLIPQVDPMTGQTNWINNEAAIDQDYDIRPAGDVDVIERREEEQKFQQDWPVIQTTPLAPKFLMDYIRLRYPKQADEYIKILEQSDKGKALVSSLATLLKAFTSKEDIASLKPEELQQLKVIQAETEAYLSGGQQQPQAQPVQ